MALDEVQTKNFFTVKKFLFFLAIGVRVMFLLLDATDALLMGTYSHTFLYILSQIAAVVIDGIIVLLIYEWVRFLLGRPVFALLTSLVYAVWPFMDAFIGGDTPARKGAILLSCIVIAFGAGRYIYPPGCTFKEVSRTKYIMASLLGMAALSYMEPVMGLGAGIASLLLMLHSRHLPAGYKKEHIYLGVCMGGWFVYTLFAGGIFPVNQYRLAMAFVVVLLHLWVLRHKGVARSAVLSSLLLGAFLPGTEEGYIYLVLIIPAVMVALWYFFNNRGLPVNVGFTKHK